MKLVSPVNAVRNGSEQGIHGSEIMDEQHTRHEDHGERAEYAMGTVRVRVIRSPNATKTHSNITRARSEYGCSMYRSFAPPAKALTTEKLRRHEHRRGIQQMLFNRLET